MSVCCVLDTGLGLWDAPGAAPPTAPLEPSVPLLQCACWGPAQCGGHTLSSRGSGVRSRRGSWECRCLKGLRHTLACPRLQERLFESQLTGLTLKSARRVTESMCSHESGFRKTQKQAIWVPTFSCQQILSRNCFF